MLLLFQIHFQKLRIIQTLLLLNNHIKTEKQNLVNLIIDSFVIESHQPSVKHLMQWLLILLLQNEKHVFIDLINNKLQSINNNRPSTISGFVTVLYNLVILQNASQWEQVIEMFLPYTMGPQFKLRILFQIALIKLYEKATEKEFLEKYKFLYNSLKQIISATSSTVYDPETIKQEFLDYIDLKNCDYSTIFYTISKNNGVSSVEWENLKIVSEIHNFKYLSFNHSDAHSEQKFSTVITQAKIRSDNIQKKITPWKDILDTPNPEGLSNFILVTSLIEKSTNLGGLSRTCEVFGIKEMVMRTAKVTSDKEFKSLSMSSENSVNVLEVKTEDLKSFILEMKKQRYSVIGAEQTSESVKLDAFKFLKKTVLVLG